ncbi:MAG TPA: ABC transporter ATP-binding protein [Candidatus Korarchaeota archaeon]|nr:ABC transporter ATP-binding protein [Candidatus Korarchaeota archaeon]
MTVLDVQDLKTYYSLINATVYAVDGVSFRVEEGEVFGLAGESGCGKTTIAKAIMRILPDNGYIAGGKIILDGADITSLSEEEAKEFRWKKVSMIFQYAMNAFNPVLRVGDQIAEILIEKEGYSKEKAYKKVRELFTMVELEPSRIRDYPHEFSGGMRQRAIIAQALALNPKLLIADEPVTALDVVTQGKIIELLKRLQKDLNLSVLFITHDLSVIAEVSNRVGIMYAGNIVEIGDTVSVFKESLHPYTAKLIGAFPSILGEKKPLQFIPGAPPDLASPPKGCKFNPRCPYAKEICKREIPPLKEVEKGHFAACHFSGELNLR